MWQSLDWSLDFIHDEPILKRGKKWSKSGSHVQDIFNQKVAILIIWAIFYIQSIQWVIELGDDFDFPKTHPLYV